MNWLKCRKKISTKKNHAITSRRIKKKTTYFYIKIKRKKRRKKQHKNCKQKMSWKIEKEKWKENIWRKSESAKTMKKAFLFTWFFTIVSFTQCLQVYKHTNRWYFSLREHWLDSEGFLFVGCCCCFYSYVWLFIYVFTTSWLPKETYYNATYIIQLTINHFNRCHRRWMDTENRLLQQQPEKKITTK